MILATKKAADDIANGSFWYHYRYIMIHTQEEHENTREKFDKIERFAYDVKNFIDFLGKTHNFDEDDMRTAMDIIYHLSREKKNGDN